MGKRSSAQKSSAARRVIKSCAMKDKLIHEGARSRFRIINLPPSSSRSVTRPHAAHFGDGGSLQLDCRHVPVVDQRRSPGDEDVMPLGRELARDTCAKPVHRTNTYHYGFGSIYHAQHPSQMASEQRAVPQTLRRLERSLVPPIPSFVGIWVESLVVFQIICGPPGWCSRE